MDKEKDYPRASYPKTNVLLVLFILLIPACNDVSSNVSPEDQIQPTSTQASLTPAMSEKAGGIQSYPVDLKFERISVEEGLSQVSVNCILQDSTGFIWFCTPNGLNKFDGYGFTVYKHDPEDPNSLSHNSVSSILEDRQGVLWIGTDGGGLNKFDRTKEQFTQYQHELQDPLSFFSNYTISAIYEDSYGFLWMGTYGGGLLKFDREGEQFTNYPIGDTWIDSIY
jgi:hypothetical protein